MRVPLHSPVCILQSVTADMAHPKILIVEDDNAIRTLLVAALRREPLDVHTAADGVIALEHLRLHRYAVVLLDLMLPRLNGYELLEGLDDVIPSSTPPVVIVMTAFDATAVKRLGSMRVQAILHKPFDIERLVEIIRDCALLYQQQLESAHVPPPVQDLGEDVVC